MQDRKAHAIRYALNAIDEYIAGSTIDWLDVRRILADAIGEEVDAAGTSIKEKGPPIVTHCTRCGDPIIYGQKAWRSSDGCWFCDATCFAMFFGSHAKAVKWEV